MYEVGCDSIFIGGELCQAPALVRKQRSIARVVHVGQPDDDRPKAALALGGTMAGNAFAGGCGGCHVLHVTHAVGAFKLP
jgi:hypothetical protein